jgi:hypothetical protein
VFSCDCTIRKCSLGYAGYVFCAVPLSEGCFLRRFFVVKNSEKTCIEDPRYVETRKTIQSFNKRFNLYLVFSVLYGLVFLNYIDIITSGGAFGGYHLWLTIMYFFPFTALTLSFPRNCSHLMKTMHCSMLLFVC